MFSQPAGGWPQGVLLQSQSWGRGHRDVGPDRIERRWDHVRKRARDKDGLRERIRRRKMVRGGGGRETPDEGGRGREAEIRHTNSKRGG